MLRPGKEITIDGVSLNYQVSRELEPGGSALVLVHGFGASLETWSDLQPYFDTFGTTVRLDLKGFGFSSKPRDGKYKARDQAALVAKFVQALPIRTVVLGGHSFGGAVAILTYYELRRRLGDGLVCGLILLDAAGYAHRFPFFISQLRNPVTRLIAGLLSPPWRARYVLKRLFVDRSLVDDERVHRYEHFLTLPGAQHALVETARQLHVRDSAEIENGLSEISVPTIVIWGEKDPVLPVAHAKKFCEQIPRCDSHILADTGHIPAEEKPAITAGIIQSFLKDL